MIDFTAFTNTLARLIILKKRQIVLLETLQKHAVKAKHGDPAAVAWFTQHKEDIKP